MAKQVSILWTGLLAVILLSLISVACGPSDEDVARAAEESIGKLAALAVANLGCSFNEALYGAGPAAGIMAKFSDLMEKLTDSLQNDGEASNREKMQLINQMNDLYEDWEEELAATGCEIPDSQGHRTRYSEPPQPG